MNIAFFGSSLVSSYWNGAATYYRGLLKALARLGHKITFYEPDAFERQSHRDIDDPDWARVVVYPATTGGWQRALDHAVRHADLIVKASGIGVFDKELATAVPMMAPPGTLKIYWDVDAPATLEEVAADSTHHLRNDIPRYDLVATYGGGDPVVNGYRMLGARYCAPIYNALDPDTHSPSPVDARFTCDLSFLGNRLPDREARVREFFVGAAARAPERSFILGGAGWEVGHMPSNVRLAGHVGTSDHSAFFGSAFVTLNINRDSMARYGFSPPTRVFEAAGCGACLITDAWTGIENFLEPGEEIFVARDGSDVADILTQLRPDKRNAVAAAGRARILAHHTYEQRAEQVMALLDGDAWRGAAA
jgi:spore maturation protein CgeB